MNLIRSVDDVIERVLNDPLSHCGGSRCRLLEAYLEGYLSGKDQHGCSLGEPLALNDLVYWLRSQVVFSEEHAGRLNASSWLSLANLAEMRSADRFDSLEVWVQLRREALESIGTEKRSATLASRFFDGCLGSFFAGVQHRPAMFFGTKDCSEHLYAFVNGMCWAERDLDMPEGEASVFNEGFQRWVDVRYPFAVGRSWGRLFAVSHVGSGFDECGYCFEHINMYLNGVAPDAQDSRSAEIIKNINERKRNAENHSGNGTK